VYNDADFLAKAVRYLHEQKTLPSAYSIKMIYGKDTRQDVVELQSSSEIFGNTKSVCALFFANSMRKKGNTYELFAGKYADAFRLHYDVKFATGIREL